MNHEYPLLLLGMHRSGTSVSMNILQRCGLYLGENLMLPNEANPRGYFENLDVYKAHEDILYKAGLDWMNPPHRLNWKSVDLSCLKKTIDDLSGHKPWGVKDPRTLFLMEGILGIIKGAYLIGVFRHPAAVAQSMINRDPITPGIAYEIWYRYSQRLYLLQKQLDFPLLHFQPDTGPLENALQEIVKLLELSWDHDIVRQIVDRKLIHYLPEREDFHLRELPVHIRRLYDNLVEISLKSLPAKFDPYKRNEIISALSKVYSQEKSPIKVPHGQRWTDECTYSRKIGIKYNPNPTRWLEIYPYVDMQAIPATGISPFPEKFVQLKIKSDGTLVFDKFHQELENTGYSHIILKDVAFQICPLALKNLLRELYSRVAPTGILVLNSLVVDDINTIHMKLWSRPATYSYAFHPPYHHDMYSLLDAIHGTGWNVRCLDTSTDSDIVYFILAPRINGKNIRSYDFITPRTKLSILKGEIERIERQEKEEQANSQKKIEEIEMQLQGTRVNYQRKTEKIIRQRRSEKLHYRSSMTQLRNKICKLQSSLDENYELLKKKETELEDLLKKFRKERDGARKYAERLKKLQNSKSYKIGRTILSPAMWIRETFHIPRKQISTRQFAKTSKKDANLIQFTPSDPKNPYYLMMGTELIRLGWDFTFNDNLDSIFRQLRFRPPGTTLVHFHQFEPYIRPQSGCNSKGKINEFYNKIKQLKAVGAKLVWTMHNYQPHDATLDDLKRDNTMKKIVRDMFDGVIVLNNAARKEAEKYFPVEMIHLVLHPSYIGFYGDKPTNKKQVRKEIKIPLKSFVFEYFGSIVPYKGMELLIESFKPLDGKHLRLLIVGRSKDDEYASRVKQMATGDNRIIFHIVPDWIPDRDIPKWFAVADVAVFGFSKILTSGSLILAMSYGLPVIAPRLGGLPELVKPDQTGWLYEPGNVVDLRTAMQEAIDTELLAHMRLMNSVTMDEVAPDKVALNLERVYASILDVH